MFMLALGISTSAVATMGPEIGKFDIPKAKEYFKVTMIVSFTLIVIVMTAFFANARPILELYTNNKEVLLKVIEVLPWFSIAIFPDLW